MVIIFSSWKFVKVIFILIILLVLVLMLCWILFSPLHLEIDTRVPRAGIRWFSIGEAWLCYDEEWWLNIQVLFLRKQMKLSDFLDKQNKTRDQKKKKPVTQKERTGMSFQKIIRVIRTFRIKDWQLAIDTGDFTSNARFYPLNFIPYCNKHVQINFAGKNFLYLKIVNSPWRILYAFLR